MRPSISLLILFLGLAVSFKASAQQAVNYDESKVPDLILPDLFVDSKGNRINSKEDWESKRRPEILGLFTDYVYGQLPTDFDTQTFEEKLIYEHPHAEYARLKEVTISVSRNSQSQAIRLKIYFPKNQEGPLPVFLLISHRNVEQVTGNPENQFFPIKQIISRGFAAAIFDVEDVSPDDKERYTHGILNQLYPEQLGQPNGMRGLSAWAWGAIRAMDYFEKDPEIDEKRAAVVGHSRGGKAALWCGANDERWAVTVANESGCGGAALSRRKFGETVERINSNFPYWFTDEFKKFNGLEGQLPIDQHQLIGLIAPRAVYVASAIEDKWADPKGEYLSLKLGSRVFSEIYLKSISLPEEYNYSPHTLLQKSAGYHLREGTHDLIGYDWEKIMDFALLQFE
jgi:hypothetical protein